MFCGGLPSDHTHFYTIVCILDILLYNTGKIFTMKVKEILDLYINIMICMQENMAVRLNFYRTPHSKCHMSLVVIGNG